jgi:hypothetical protein
MRLSLMTALGCSDDKNACPDVCAAVTPSPDALRTTFSCNDTKVYSSYNDLGNVTSISFVMRCNDGSCTGLEGSADFAYDECNQYAGVVSYEVNGVQCSGDYVPPAPEEAIAVSATCADFCDNRALACEWDCEGCGHPCNSCRSDCEEGHTGACGTEFDAWLGCISGQEAWFCDKSHMSSAWTSPDCAPQYLALLQCQGTPWGCLYDGDTCECTPDGQGTGAGCFSDWSCCYGYSEGLEAPTGSWGPPDYHCVCTTDVGAACEETIADAKREFDGASRVAVCPPANVAGGSGGSADLPDASGGMLGMAGTNDSNAGFGGVGGAAGSGRGAGLPGASGGMAGDAKAGFGGV